MGKREDMLQVALKLFSAEGYENVGIQKIVENTGVKKPTLYHYFGSKQGLLKALLSENFSNFFKNLRASSMYSGDIVSSLETVIKEHFNFIKNTGEFYRFFLSLVFSSESSEAKKTVELFAKEQFNIIEEVFSSAEKDHGNMSGRSKHFAITFQGMINSYITMFYSGYLGLDEDLVYKSCHQFMHGIFS